MNALRFRWMWVAASVLLFTACPGAPETHPCADVACGEGVCEVLDSGAQCRCNEGATLEGSTCVPEAVDPCDPNPCMESHRTTCTVEAALARCACDPGYFEDSSASVCVLDDPCEPNPCTEANRGVCTVSGTTAVCGCNDGYALENGVCERTLPACTGAHEDGDSFEPDECASIATAVGSGGITAEAHTLMPAADQDWFRVQVTATTVYRFAVSGASTQVSAKLFTDDGVTELFSVSGMAPEITHRADANGTLYYRVRAVSQTVTGSYSVSINAIGSDDHGNTSATATMVTASDTPRMASIEYAGDVDFFAFDATADHVYFVGCAMTTGSCAVTVFDSTGAALTTSAPTEETWAKKLAAGRYYVRVAPTAGSTGAYTLTIADRGLDDHPEVNAGATAIPTAGAGGEIQYYGDVDVLRFTGVAKHIYWVRCTRRTDLSNCYVTLRDGTDAVLAAHTTGADAIVRYEVPADGDYFVRVSADGSDLGGYDVTVEDLGEDDYGDTLATAHAVPFTGTPYMGAGRFELRDDYDYFSVPVQGDTVYAVKCVPQTASACAISLRGGTDNLLAQDSTGPEYRAAYRTTAGQTVLYVRLGSNFSGATGTYTWSFEVQLDDHGNDIPNATPITFTNGVASGSGYIEVTGDADVFAFPAVAGTIYKFTCTRNGVGSCNVSARDESMASTFGTTLASDGNDNDGLVFFRAPATKTYWARFGARSDHSGAYDWAIEEWALLDEDANTFGTARAITVGVQTTGIMTQADEDWFAVSLSAATSYTVTAASTGTGVSMIPGLTVFGPDGSTPVGTTGASPRSFTTVLAGTYYIRLWAKQSANTSQNLTATGGYQLTVQ